MDDKEIHEIWQRLKNANTVSNGIDQMLATDMVQLLKENERLRKKLMHTSSASSEFEITNVLRFDDGKYLGIFGKVDKLIDAVKFNGDWESQLHMENSLIKLNEEKYGIKTVCITTKLLD